MPLGTTMEIYAGQLTTEHLGKEFSFKQTNGILHYKLHIKSYKCVMQQLGAAAGIIEVEIETYRTFGFGSFDDRTYTFAATDILEIEEIEALKETENAGH